MDDNVLTLDNEYQEDVDLEGEVYAVGERGYSAYEIALQNGYVGTEEEWLESLKGDKGDPGEGVPEGGTAGQILSKVDGTDYNTEWIDVPDIDGKTNYLGELSDFNSPSNALNVDNLDEDKIYVIMNDVDNTLYSKLVCKITTQSYGVLVYNLNNMGLARENTQCLYVRKHITTSGTRTNYLEIFGQATSFSPTSRVRYYKWTIFEENGILKADMISTNLNVATTNTAQDISGKKTFTTNLPESSLAPSDNNQLTNKKYVDDAIQEAQFCIGNIRDYNTEAKALNLDDLEDGKTYVIINNLTPPIGGTSLYLKVTSETYGEIKGYTSLAYNKLTAPVYYICKHIHTETLEDDTTRTYYAQLCFEANLLDYVNDYTITNMLYEFYEKESSGSGGYLTTQVTSNKIYAVSTNGVQNISGKKTFTTLPESSVVPTTDNQLVNKKYVDDNGGQKIQYDTMPTASEDTVGEIVQYIGETDTDYTNGYFYIGTTDGEDPATYSWEQLNVQPGSSGGDDEVYFIENINANNPFIFEGKKKGIYILKYPMINFPYKINEDSNRFTLPNNQQIFRIDLYQDMDKTTQGRTGVCKIYYYTSVNYTLLDYCEANYNIAYSNTSYVVLSANSIVTYGKYVNSIPQTFDGVKTFTSIPEQSNTNAPTLDTQFTNKAYVDSKAIQYSTMPTASSSTVGKIVQYTGTTDANYTNGYFYQVVSDGESTPTYSWEQLDVQPSSGSGGVGFPQCFIPIPNGLADSFTRVRIGNSSSAGFDNSMKTALQTFLQQCYDSNNYYFEIAMGSFKVGSSNKTGTIKFYYHPGTYNLLQKPTAIEVYGMDDIYANQTQVYVFRLYIQLTWNEDTLTVGNTTFIRDFEIPYLSKANTTSYTPSTDYNPATKKYVDDSIASAITDALGGNY